MGPEETNRDGLLVYFNGICLGELTKAPLRFMPPPACSWVRCKTRKRFIKLSGGFLGVQKRQAEAMARAAMKNGCPSYQDLWTACLTYFIREIIRGILIQEHIIEESTRDIEITVEIEPGQIELTDSPAGASE